MYCILGSNLHSFLFYITVVLVSFLFVCVRGTISRHRYDRIVWVVCILLFLFYPKEVDDLIIGSTQLRFPEGGLYFTRYSNILIYIQQDATLHSLFYLETALHVSGIIVTHLQEHKTTVTAASGNSYTVLLSAAIVEELEVV